MNKRLKVLLIALILMFVVLISAGIFIVATKDKKTPTQQTDQPTNQQPQKSNQPTENKTQTPSPSTGGSTNNTGGTGSPKTEEEKKKPWFSIELMYAQQAGNTLAVRVQAKGTSKGTCELSLNKAGMPSIKRTAELTLDAERDADKLKAKTICGFLIPIEQVYASGKWDLKVVLKVDDVESEPIEKRIDIKR